jgi:hypothetical protein
MLRNPELLYGKKLKPTRIFKWTFPLTIIIIIVIIISIVPYNVFSEEVDLGTLKIRSYDPNLDDDTTSSSPPPPSSSSSTTPANPESSDVN